MPHDRPVPEHSSARTHLDVESVSHVTRKLLSRLINDAGLTPDALRIVLYVESLGDGWHELRQSALAVLLNGRGEKPIRGARENAMERGWLDWRRGGRNSDLFRFKLPEEDPAGAPLPSRTGGERPSLSAPQGEHTPVIPSHSGEHTPPLPSRMGDESVPMPLNSPGGVQTGASHARDPLEGFPYRKPLEDEDGGDGGDAQGRVSEAADSVIEEHAELLGHAALALRAYFRTGAVSAVRQEGYALGVVGLLEGDGTVKWADAAGAPIDTVLWPRLLAAALNSCCTDEPTGSRPRGSVDNLRTKLGILLRPHDNSRFSSPRRDAAGRGGSPAPRSSAAPRRTPRGSRRALTAE